MNRIFYNKITARIFLKPLLNVHSRIYRISGILACILNNGIHPKHQIIKYEQWFLSKINNNWVVLDVGCNTGIMVKAISSKAKYIYGIDIEKKHIEKAKEKRQERNIKYICADATKYDFSNCKKIDVVTLSNVLEHIEKRVEFIQKLVKQINWNSEKLFLIRVPMIDREWIAIYKKELGLDYKLDNSHFIEYTFNEFKKELTKAGLILKEYHICFGEIYAMCEAKEKNSN